MNLNWNECRLTYSSICTRYASSLSRSSWYKFDVEILILSALKMLASWLSVTRFDWLDMTEENERLWYLVKEWCSKCNDCFFNNTRYIQRSNSNHYMSWARSFYLRERSSLYRHRRIVSSRSCSEWSFWSFSSKMSKVSIMLAMLTVITSDSSDQSDHFEILITQWLFNHCCLRNHARKSSNISFAAKLFIILSNNFLSNLSAVFSLFKHSADHALTDDNVKLVIILILSDLVF